MTLINDIISSILAKTKILNKSNFSFSIDPRSWFGTPGKIGYLFKPNNEEELSEFLKLISYFDSKIRIIPIGMLSNTLVSDQGFFSGIIIKFIKFNSIEYDKAKSIISAGSGVLDKNLSIFALENNIKNFEFLYTIPGNLGGAVFMNAGCFGGEIKDIIDSIECFDLFGKKLFLKRDDIVFSYRKSNLDNLFITKINFIASSIGDKNEIESKINQCISLRDYNQPKNIKTGGSTFKNPTNHHLKAWQMIDMVGLRGHRIGGAHFSEKHCNFIVNDMNASSNDIKNLILEAQNRILKKFNVFLEQEIFFLGD